LPQAAGQRTLGGFRGERFVGRIILWLLLAVGLAASAALAREEAAGVLVLADSNGEGPFGGTLYDGLRSFRDPVGGAALKVLIFAKCGAGASDWVIRERANIDCGAWRCDGGRPISDCHHFRGGYIPNLAELYKDLGTPRHVTVVALGLNMIIGDRTTKLSDARRLIGELKAQKSACIWVGPPQAGDGFVRVQTYDSFEADLKRTVTQAGCRYVTSDDKTDRRSFGAGSKDDHYSRPEAIAWAIKVLRELESGVREELAKAR